MSTPPAPPQAELQDRTFSFFPPIHGIGNNEWRLREASWSEMLVRNTREDLEIHIPRRYFGPVSEVDQPVMIVGLTQELEYRAGTVWPMKKRVLEMPSSPLAPPPGPRPAPDPNEPKGLSAMMGSSASGTESRIGKMIGVSLAGILLITLFVWALVKFTPETKPTFVAKDQGYLELTREDDYFDIVRKLGQPAEDRYKPNSGELHYRAMFYPNRGYAIILMGTKPEDVRFIGAMGLGPDGKGWSPLYAVDFARGANTMGMLRGLAKF